MKIFKAQNISFEAKKPNYFKGFDYACVRQFKAPVEKFNSKQDLDFWATEKVNILIKNKNIVGKNEHTKELRNNIIHEWRQALGFNSSNMPLILVILSSILKDIKTSNDKLPPVLSKETLIKTIENIENSFLKMNDTKFNFKNEYCNNLRQEYGNGIPNNYTGWIEFPAITSNTKDSQHNIDKLKVFSNKTWCTQAYLADNLLKKGDIYIWLENGMPKICLRFTDRILSEIQDENNDGFFNPKYFNIIHTFICKKNCAMEEKALKAYWNAKDLKNKENI